MICYNCKNILGCTCILEDEEITIKNVAKACKIMGGFKPRKKGESMINLEGFEKVVSAKGVKLFENAGKLTVSEKSKWFGFGKELVKKHDLSRFDRVDLFVKKGTVHPEIIVRFQKEGVFKFTNANSNFGFRTNLPFKLYQNLEGVYTEKEALSKEDGFYIWFSWEKNFR